MKNTRLKYLKDITSALMSLLTYKTLKMTEEENAHGLHKQAEISANESTRYTTRQISFASTRLNDN